MTIVTKEVTSPVAEFPVSICSTSKFICSSDAGATRLLITGDDNSYKNNVYKNRMMRILFQLKIEFIITYLKMKGKKAYM